MKTFQEQPFTTLNMGRKIFTSIRIIIHNISDALEYKCAITKQVDAAVTKVYNVGPKALIVALKKSSIFWDIMPSSLVKVN
jgi:hypothetical protein